MVVTVVGCNGGACGGGFAEHGGGCPRPAGHAAVPPGPALQAASTTTATAGSARTSRLQARQAPQRRLASCGRGCTTTR